MRIALDDELFRHLDAADLRHPADVVAAQVDEHQVLGDFLGIVDEFLLHRPILGLGAAPSPGAGQGPVDDLAALPRALRIPLRRLDPRQDFRRRADDVEAVEMHEDHVRRRIQAAQRPIEIDRRTGEGNGHALREHHLHHVAGADVLADAFHSIHELLAPEGGDEILLLDGLIGARRGDGRRRGVEQRGALGERLLGRVQGAGLRSLGERDQLHAARDVVEDHHVRGDHEQDVRRVHVVRRRRVRKPPLHVAHGVVAEVAHQSAEEARQVRQVWHHETLGKRFDGGKGIVRVLSVDHAPVLQRGEGVASNAQHGARGQADDGIARPLLAALRRRFEQIGIGRVGELQIGGERRLQVREDLEDDRDVGKALAGKGVEFLLVHGSA